MSVPVRQHADVRRDVRDIAVYIADYNASAAARFSYAVEATIDGLSDFPRKGSPKHFSDPKLVGIRSYTVDGFRQHLVLYRPDADGGITVLMVTHGARNLEPLLRRRV